MKFMTLASITMSLTFMKSAHPVMLMFIILTQTMILCIMIWVTTKLNWFSYILFLIFLGGLMVLFIYISSLASNEMFKMNIKSTLKTTSASILAVCLTMIILNNQMLTQTYFTLTASFNMIYSDSMAAPSMSTMIYLLLTLIVVVKMTSKYEGPVRNMIFVS